MLKTSIVALALSIPVPLIAQLPLREGPVCLILTYDSVSSGMVLTDLPARLQLDRGDAKGNVRVLDSALAKVKLDRGQGWTVSQERDSAFSYFLTLAGANSIMLAYYLKLSDSSLRGSVAALYVDKANRRSQQRDARVLANIEPCPARP